MSDYDNKAAMANHRNQWAKVGVQPISLVIPLDHRSYLQGTAKVLTAHHLLKQIENGGTDVHEVFANRIPRLGFNRDELTDMVLDKLTEEEDLPADKNELQKKLASMADGLRLKGLANANYEAGIAERDFVKANYHGAREYALAYGLSGQWILLQLYINGYTPPRTTV